MQATQAIRTITSQWRMVAEVTNGLSKLSVVNDDTQNGYANGSGHTNGNGHANGNGYANGNGHVEAAQKASKHASGSEGVANGVNGHSNGVTNGAH